MLNRAGRPLEFHCTAPVRPGRAQEILYGPTLRPYLYGEQIGRALLDKGKAVTGIVFTDVPPVLALREWTDRPIVCIPPRESDATADVAGDSDSRLRFDDRHPSPQPLGLRLFRFAVGGRELVVPETHQGDSEPIQRNWGQYISEADLHEPFERIREAIDEARRTAG